MVLADPERQGAGRPGADVQSIHPWLDQLLQSVLQIGVVSNPSSDRRLPRQMGTRQVQDSSTKVEGCSGLARTCDPNIAGSVCPLAASASRRPNIGSRMSREAHVRFWERVGVGFPRATRLPLNRQAERYAREGVPLSLSTLADQVGTCAGVLEPLFRLIEATSWRRDGCTATTPPYRCWPRARPPRAACGSTCATTGPSAASIPRRPCSTSRPTGGASTHRAPRRLDRGAAGRRLRGLRQAVRRRAQAGADHRGRVLGPRAEKVLRAGRHRGRGAPEGPEEGGRDRAAGARSGAAHGRAVRHRARGERPSRGRAAGGAAPALRPHRGGPGRLDAGRAGPPAARRPGGEGDGLHARPLAVLRPLPRRRTRVHE